MIGGEKTKPTWRDAKVFSLPISPCTGHCICKSTQLPLMNPLVIKVSELLDKRNTESVRDQTVL